MSKWMENPIVLLLLTGSLIGLNFPLGKLAGEAGISPVIWALIFSLGVCLTLLPILVTQGKMHIPLRPSWRYIVLSAVLSYILPNLLLFSIMLSLGAGYMGLMFALSPVFTLLFAAALRMGIPNKTGLFGLFLGLVGASIVSLAKGVGGEAAQWQLVVLALCIPLCLALGNVYRSWDWPKDAEPDGLAFWSHAVAVAFYLGVLVAGGNAQAIAQVTQAPYVVVAQLLVSGMIFPTFFRLQKIGGPVLLSQIGYVSAAVGLVAAVWILGERYDAPTWWGAAVIALGILFTLKSQLEKRAEV